MEVFWPMIGKGRQIQGKLFYTHLNIEKRAGENHPPLNMDEFIDYDFIYGEVKRKKDGSKGNVSVAPPMILNLILLLLFYNMK